MAFTVEDGSGVANANSLVSIADAAEYFENQGNTSWAELDEADQQANLVKGTAYLADEGQFPFRGSKTGGYAQRTAWPRSGATEKRAGDIPDNVIPWRVKDAVCEAALAASVEGVELNPALQAGGLIKSKTVGPLTTVYQDGARAVTVYTAVTRLLGPLLVEAGGNDDMAGPQWTDPERTIFDIGMMDHPGTDSGLLLSDDA